MNWIIRQRLIRSLGLAGLSFCLIRLAALWLGRLKSFSLVIEKASFSMSPDQRQIKFNLRTFINKFWYDTSVQFFRRTAILQLHCDRFQRLLMLTDGMVKWISEYIQDIIFVVLRVFIDGHVHIQYKYTSLGSEGRWMSNNNYTYRAHCRSNRDQGVYSVWSNADIVHLLL